MYSIGRGMVRITHVIMYSYLLSDMAHSILTYVCIVLYRIGA